MKQPIRTVQGKASNFRKMERQTRFLAAFSGCGSILQASLMAQIDRTTHYVWVREDPTYAVRFEESRRQAVQSLEDEAVRRALEGIHKPVLYKGKQVYVDGQPLYETKYSDALLICLLKAHAPEKYREGHQVVVDWDGDIDKLTPAQFEKMTNQLMERAYEGDVEAMERDKRKVLATGSVRAIHEYYETVEPDQTSKAPPEISPT